MSDKQFNAALDLMKRLPPQRVDRHLSYLIDLQPELCEDLLNQVDTPLKIGKDKKVNRDYLICDYNRDGDSYRSCWSSEYDPPLEDGLQPSERLRSLEVDLNTAFNVYRQQYFEGGVSSCYLWDMDDGFAGVILIKKSSDSTRGIKGCWDSIHVVEVTERHQMKTASYKITSTIMLWLQTASSKSGIINLGGSLTKESQKNDVSCTNGHLSHIKNIGQLVENSETSMRNSLSEIYFSKTKDIVNCCRSVNRITDEQHKKEISRQIHNRIKNPVSQQKEYV